MARGLRQRGPRHLLPSQLEQVTFKHRSPDEMWEEWNGPCWSWTRGQLAGAGADLGGGCHRSLKQKEEEAVYQTLAIWLTAHGMPAAKDCRKLEIYYPSPPLTRNSRKCLPNLELRCHEGGGGHGQGLDWDLLPAGCKNNPNGNERTLKWQD